MNPTSDPMQSRLVCESWEEIVSASNALAMNLPLEVRQRFNRIFSDYLHRYGIEGVFERLNGRTVATIFAEYERDEARPIDPILSGEVDRIRYRLYEAPDKED